MNKNRIVRTTLAALTVVAALAFAVEGVAHAQQGKMQRGPGGGGPGGGSAAGPGPQPGGGGAPAAKIVKPQTGPAGRVTRSTPQIANGRPMVVKKKQPGFDKKMPPLVVKKHPGKIKHAHRRWRPGLKWRWLAVPTIVIAEDLDWCHYHRYRVSGMHFHSSVRCHRHERWNHPALRYVEAY